MKRLLAVAAKITLATMLLLLPGCGQQSGESEIASSESNRWLELLRVIPENEETMKAAYLTDLAYMLEKMPDPEYPVGRSHPMFGNGPGAYNDQEWKATLGFVVADVEQTIYAGPPPVKYYQAVRGNFSREDVDNAAMTGPGNENGELISYAGHEFYSWGRDMDIRLSMRSNVRTLGRGHRLALVDDFIFWVLWTDGIKEMIDSYEDNIPSLADNEDYRLLAGALEELDTVNAFFSAESHSLDHFYELSPREKLEEEIAPAMKGSLIMELDRKTRLKPYQALATGAGKDEKGYYLAIALVNADPKSAKENAELLEQRINEAKLVWPSREGEQWSDLIDSAVIETRGRLTLARLYGPVVGFWDRFEIQGVMPYEPLLIHE